MCAKRSFSKKLRQVWDDPSSTGLGVELGRQCVRHRIAVREIADKFSVTRATVHNWMTGRTLPSGPTLVRVKDFIRQLKETPIASSFHEMK
jgi:transcriptional regulator with XRE-family HTH domain